MSAAWWETFPSCSSGFPRSGSPRSALPTGVPGRTRRRTRSRPFAWRSKLGATGLESDVWLTEGRRGRARPRRRRAGPLLRCPARSEAIAAPTLPATSRPSPSSTTSAAPTSSCHSTSKDDAAIDAVLATARNAGGDAIGRLWVCHPQWQTLATFRSMDADVKLVDSTRLRAIREGTERRAATLADAGDRRAQHAPHRLERWVSRRCCTGSSASRSRGTCSTTICCAPRCAWGWTACSATTPTA